MDELKNQLIEAKKYLQKLFICSEQLKSSYNQYYSYKESSIISQYFRKVISVIFAVFMLLIYDGPLNDHRNFILNSIHDFIAMILNVVYFVVNFITRSVGISYLAVLATLLSLMFCISYFGIEKISKLMKSPKKIAEYKHKYSAASQQFKQHTMASEKILSFLPKDFRTLEMIEFMLEQIEYGVCENKSQLFQSVREKLDREKLMKINENVYSELQEHQNILNKLHQTNRSILANTKQMNFTLNNIDKGVTELNKITSKIEHKFSYVNAYEIYRAFDYFSEK